MTGTRARQELEHVVARLRHFALERLAAAHDIPDPLFLLRRDPHRGQFPGPLQPRQFHRIAFVVFALYARPLLNVRQCASSQVALATPVTREELTHVGAGGQPSHIF